MAQWWERGGNLRSPVDSIREAVLTVSPKRQYRGMVSPTTPATQGPGNTKKKGNKKPFKSIVLEWVLLEA